MCGLQWHQDLDVNHTFAALLYQLHNGHVTLHVLECTCKQMVVPSHLHSSSRQISKMLQLEKLHDVQVVDENEAAVTYQNILYLGKFMVFEFMYSQKRQAFELSVGAQPYFRYLKHFCIEGSASAPGSVNAVIATFVDQCKLLQRENHLDDRVLLLITSDAYYTYFLQLAELTSAENACFRVNNVRAAMQHMGTIDACCTHAHALDVMAMYSASMSAISAQFVQGLFSEDTYENQRKAQKLLKERQHEDIDIMNVLYFLTKEVGIQCDDPRLDYKISYQGIEKLKKIQSEVRTYIKNLNQYTFLDRMIASPRACCKCSTLDLQTFQKKLEQARTRLCENVERVRFCRQILLEPLRHLQQAENLKAKIEASYKLYSVLEHLITRAH